MQADLSCLMLGWSSSLQHTNPAELELAMAALQKWEMVSRLRSLDDHKVNPVHEGATSVCFE